MKKNILKVALVVAVATMMTSCYSYTTTVGKGPQNGTKVVSKNHYLIGGLVPVSTADANKLADGAADYSVNVKHSIIDMILGAITSGIYSPTTVTVTK